MMFDRIKDGLWWDRAWSLVEGCTAVSRACRLCWARTMATIRQSNPNAKVQARYGGLLSESGQWNGTIRERWEDIGKPTPRQRPAVWTIWTDLFHEKVTWNFQYKAFARMAQCPQHIFIVCTKRPHIMAERLPLFYYHFERNHPGVQLPLPNVIGMTTVEDQAQADIRIPELFHCRLAYRALSCEPLLGPIKSVSYKTRYLDWVIAGCESGRGRAQSDADWFRHLRSICADDSVPFFLKQLDIDGTVTPAPSLDGFQWLELPGFVGAA